MISSYDFDTVARRKRGTLSQAIGRSRGGITTKILALTDSLGNLVDFRLMPGQAHDLRAVPDLIEDLCADYLLAGRAFDADWLRARIGSTLGDAPVGVEQASPSLSWSAQ